MTTIDLNASAIAAGNPEVNVVGSSVLIKVRLDLVHMLESHDSN